MNYIMKSSELHRLITENDWILIRVSGSHYIYQKGYKTYPVPYHGSKEVGKGLEKKVKKGWCFKKYDTVSRVPIVYIKEC